MPAALTDWYDELATNAPGVGNASMEFALKKTIEQFLRESGAYAAEVPGLTILANKGRYTIPKQTQGPVLYIIDVFFQSRPLSPMTSLQWQRRTVTEGDVPTSFRGIIDRPGVFDIYPVPTTTQADKLIPYVAFGYDPECNEALPSILRDRWYDYILSGAISRLCSQPNKPYTDAAIAVLHGRRFRNGIATAREMAGKQYVRQDAPVAFPKWA